METKRKSFREINRTFITKSFKDNPNKAKEIYDFLEEVFTNIQKTNVEITFRNLRLKYSIDSVKEQEELLTLMHINRVHLRCEFDKEFEKSRYHEFEEL
jgi:predicted translin family RNA/ssDNA-binding protein